MHTRTQTHSKTQKTFSRSRTPVCHFCKPLFSRMRWSLLSNKRSKLSNPTALGFPMGNTCAAYWMPPIAVIAPTMIANGGSDSNGMCCCCYYYRARVSSSEEEEEEEEEGDRKKAERRRTLVFCCFFFFRFSFFSSALFFFVLGVFLACLGEEEEPENGRVISSE